MLGLLGTSGREELVVSLAVDWVGVVERGDVFEEFGVLGTLAPCRCELLGRGRDLALEAFTRGSLVGGGK
jgi:hypothetical protein